MTGNVQRVVREIPATKPDAVDKAQSNSVWLPTAAFPPNRRNN